jgi:hypothetical protein
MPFPNVHAVMKIKRIPQGLKAGLVQSLFIVQAKAWTYRKAHFSAACY